MEPLVELRGVAFGYGTAAVLEDVNLHLHRGQFAAVVGPSGAGKTSLLKLVLGTLKPSRGSVYVGGAALAGQPAPNVSYVPQVDTVDWSFPVTVEQAVLMGRTQRGGLWPWPSRADRRRMAEVLERLQIGDLARRHIRDLSGGQQQRVFLARALVAEPDLLVLDEPTSGVDMQTAEKMLHLLLELNRQSMTILMTTHDLNMAAAHVPWIVCLNRRLIAQGRPAEVFTEEILSETYRGDMMVIRHGSMLLVHQRPHWHTLEQAAPSPVPAHAPGDDLAADIAPVCPDDERAAEEEEDEPVVRAVPV